MAAKYSFEMEKFLECPICLGQCEDPRVLPCLHSLCLKCLQQHIQTSAQGSRFNCPSCRRDCDVPAGGVPALPKNFMLNTLRDLLKKGTPLLEEQPSQRQEEREVGERECCNKGKGDTQHTDVTVFCVDCAEFYCSSCESSHRFFSVSAEHHLRPASEVSTRDALAAEAKIRPARCDQHRGQYIDMYCETCSVPMCMKCCLLSHQQHKYRELYQKADESRAELGDMTQTAETVSNTLEERLKQLDKSQKNIEKDAKEVCEQIRTAAEELRDMITQQEEDLIQKVTDSQKDAVTDVRAAYKETDIDKIAIQSLKCYIKALQTSGDVIDQVTHTPGLQEQLRKLEAVPELSVSWTVNLKRNSQSVAALSAMIGTVSVDETVVKYAVLDDSMKKALGDPVLSLKPNVGNEVSGLVVIDDCVYVTGWCEPDLWVHNIQTHTNKQHTITDMAAVGMTTVHDKTNNNNTLVITDINNKIHFVTISPQNMNITKHTVKDIPFSPRRVSVDSKTGKLIIANYTDKQIVVCDNTGNIENRVKVKTSIEDMWCVLTTDDGFVVIDGSSPGRVHWVTKAGDVTHTYGQRDGEHLNYPCHMTFDPDGRLIVSDSNNHRLHMIDVNKRLFDYVLTDKDDIREPTNVYLDKTTQRLFVGHRDTKHVITVSVYNWPYTTGTHHTLNVQLNRYT